MKALDKAVYSKLTGSTALCALVGGTANPRIFNTYAPQDTVTPYVVFQKQGGGHFADTPHENVAPIYMSKAVGGGLSDCVDIEVEITSALDRQDLSIDEADGYAHYATFKQGHLHFAEEIGGGSILFHIGGLYRVGVTSI